MRAVVLAAMVSASVAWPCSGDICDRHGTVPLIDGGLPVNFPLLLTDLMRTASGTAEVFLPDGGSVLEQVRSLDGTTAVVDTSLWVEGERYQVRHVSPCSGSEPADGGFVDNFVVLPAKPVLTQGVSIELEDAGVGSVPQYSGSTCSEGVPSSFARLRFVVDPSVVESLKADQ
jgi:hypothetical protein